MSSKRSYWLIKSEPFKYSFSKLLEDGVTCWDGVRNFEARNNLRAMRVGDFVLFYHSNEGKEIVGVAKIARAAYQDPTTDEDWSVVDVEPVVALKVPVLLATVRATASLGDMDLLRRSRLSVTPVTEAEFETVLTLGKTTLPKRASAAKTLS